MNYSELVRSKLLEQNIKEALNLVSNMSQTYLKESGTVELETKINYLISLCGDMTGQYSVGQIKSNKMATA